MSATEITEPNIQSENDITENPSIGGQAESELNDESENRICDSSTIINDPPIQVEHLNINLFEFDCSYMQASHLSWTIVPHNDKNPNAPQEF